MTQQLSDRVIELERAIGVCVPTCLRVLLKLLPEDATTDREITQKTLDRVNRAMRYNSDAATDN